MCPCFCVCACAHFYAFGMRVFMICLGELPSVCWCICVHHLSCFVLSSLFHADAAAANPPPVPFAASLAPQSAFAYTAVIPSDDVGDETDISGGAPKAARMVTVQRLRVSTVRTEDSPSVGSVAMMADPATVAAVLAHKVVSEARRR